MATHEGLSFHLRVALRNSIEYNSRSLFYILEFLCGTVTIKFA
jgi:hypothetical protein